MGGWFRDGTRWEVFVLVGLVDLVVKLDSFWLVE